MNDPAPSSAPPRKSPWRLLPIIALVALAGVGVAFFFLPITPFQRHRRAAERIDKHLWVVQHSIVASVGSTLDLKGDARTRNEAAKALLGALSNVLWTQRYDPNRKLREIADRLDRTQAAELETGEGCLRLVAEIEGLDPAVKEYAWFEYLRELQEKGEIPRLAPTRK